MTEMRILALTEDASFAFALSQLPLEHDVVAVDSIEQLGGQDLSFQVALVDLGTTRRGLVGASDVIRSGVSAPCLVVGDENPIELAVQLARNASVLVRPFTLDELDARLEELMIAAHGRKEWSGTRVGARTAADGDGGGMELAASAGPAVTVPSGPSGDRPVGRVEFRMREAEPLDPEGRARTEWTSSLLEETAQLERFLDRVPEVVDRRAVAGRLLDMVEGNLGPLVSVVWVPEEDGGYAALASRRLESDERVPFDQSLFLSFETNLDAVLVSCLDPMQHPAAGIPGIRGDTLIAAALRNGQALQGVVMAAGNGYTDFERDQLLRLALESVPALAVAEVFERLRSRRPPAALAPQTR
ncbi:MAG: hypothetical protein M3252_00990 [Actinomycetota bacterium]|nr:hypothetical protein [Actinomycetota bacterium]